MAKNDLIIIGAVVVAAAGGYYAYSNNIGGIKSKIDDAIGGILGGGAVGNGEVETPAPPPAVKSFVAAGEWGGAMSAPVAEAMIRSKPDLIVGLGNYDSNETLFGPIAAKFKTAKIPAIWAKGADSDDYLTLFEQEEWELKYEPADIIFCVLNSANPTTLEDMLKTSTAKWKIVVLNSPPFSPSSKYGQDVTAQEKLSPILTKYKVSLVLSAKNALYFRYIPKFGPNTTSGVTFVGIGTATDKFSGSGSPNGATRIVQGKAGYLKVDIGNNLDCKFLTPTGAVLDQFTVFEWK